MTDIDALAILARQRCDVNKLVGIRLILAVIGVVVGRTGTNAGERPRPPDFSRTPGTPRRRARWLQSLYGMKRASTAGSSLSHDEHSRALPEKRPSYVAPHTTRPRSDHGRLSLPHPPHTIVIPALCFQRQRQAWQRFRKRRMDVHRVRQRVPGGSRRDMRQHTMHDLSGFVADKCRTQDLVRVGIYHQAIKAARGVPFYAGCSY
jgi:hypothetical protein